MDTWSVLGELRVSTGDLSLVGEGKGAARAVVLDKIRDVQQPLVGPKNATNTSYELTNSPLV